MIAFKRINGSLPVVEINDKSDMYALAEILQKPLLVCESDCYEQTYIAIIADGVIYKYKCEEAHGQKQTCKEECQNAVTA